MRCFTGIALSAEMRAALAEIARRHAPGRGVSWTIPDKLHVTLIFLGEVDPPQIPMIADACRAAAAQVPRFTIAAGRIGAFPNPQRPRILWAGVDDPAAGCAAWVKFAQPLLNAVGFPPEQRPYTPHITLARARSPEGERALKTVLASTSVPAVNIAVREVTLFESRPGDSVYYPLATFPLVDVTPRL